MVGAVLLMGMAARLQASEPEWRVGVQTYTFHNFTLAETLDKTQALGLDCTEAFFFQELGKPFPMETYLNFDMSDSDRERLLTEYRKRGIEPVAFGVASYGTAEEWEQFFSFAKAMGAKIITAEPELNQLDMIESLAKKYDIEVAIHNHPNPSIYASADVVVKALEGRSSMLGVCADIGHWARVGEDPLANLKRLEGRVKIVHLKDLTKGEMKDATWGTGILPVKAFVEELKRQNFDGLITIEYENYESDSLDDIRQSLKFLKSCSE